MAKPNSAFQLKDFPRLSYKYSPQVSERAGGNSTAIVAKSKSSTH